MAARTLEGRLVTRLLPVLAASLLCVAGAGIFVTARALERADEEQAREVAALALRGFVAELGEGDAPDDAAREVLASVAGERERVTLVKGERVFGEASSGSSVASASSLAAGTCVETTDDGSHWCACAAEEGALRAVGAIRTDDHRAVVRTLFASMAGVVLLALFAAVVATRRALRPPVEAVESLALWSERVAAGEDVPPRQTDTLEIDRLSASIATLVRALVEALARERANSAHIAHELRTPLTAMRLELDQLPPESSAIAARLRADVVHLSGVIDAILLLSAPLSQERVPSVVNVADVARKIAPAGTKVDAPDEALVDAEAHLVELALQNLMHNANKHARGALSEIRVAREGDLVRVSVLDRGPGLDAAARRRIFERYWRETTGGEGSGLGLALVRAVALRHGGEADARSRPEGGLDIGFSMGPVLGWHEARAT